MNLIKPNNICMHIRNCVSSSYDLRNRGCETQICVRSIKRVDFKGINFQFYRVFHSLWLHARTLKLS